MINDLTPAERVTRQRAVIMRDKRFTALAGVLMMGTWELDPDVPTAYTNGRDIIYGEKFIAGLDDATLRFVILHEYYHIMYQHMVMWRHLTEEDSHMANVAMDMVINLSLQATAGTGADGFIKVWEHAVCDSDYVGLDTGEVYRRLKANAQAQQQQGQGKPGKGQPGGQPRTASGKPAQEMDEHDALGEGALTAEEAQTMAEQVDQAMRQGAQFAGRMGGTMDRALTDLLKPTVDWQTLLRDFVQTHCRGDDLSTWRKPSRRWLARDVYMPSRYSEAAKGITIGVDTSGSIGEEDLKRAMTEIKEACDLAHPERVDVIYWDADVSSHEIYEGDDVSRLTEVTKPKGGGGTRVGAMLDFMNAKGIRPDCIIIFTDGFVESDWGGNGWVAPVLWCVSTKGRTAPNGKTLYVPV